MVESWLLRRRVTRVARESARGPIGRPGVVPASAAPERIHRQRHLLAANLTPSAQHRRVTTAVAPATLAAKITSTSRGDSRAQNTINTMVDQ